MKKAIYITLISFLCMCMKCKDSMLPEGIETTVKGNIYDRRNDIPVANQKLVIQELNYEPGFQIGSNINHFAEIDSTYTNENGDYEITFTTTGNGDSYQIFSQRTNQIWIYQQNAVRIENIGSSNEINFNFLHLYPIILIIKINSELDFLPIRIHHRYTLNRSLEDINTISNEIIKQVYVPLNEVQTVEFYRTKPDGQSQVFIKEIQPVITIEPVNIEIEIKNSDFEDY